MSRAESVRRTARWLVVGVLVAAVAAVLAGPGAGPVAAAPVGSDVEILAHPDSDGALVVGTAALQGRVARLEVRRDGAVVGSVAARIDGDTLAVNRPGGHCWGSGSGLASTPDLVAGDTLLLSVDGVPAARTVVAGGRIVPWPEWSGSTVTYRAEVPPGTAPSLVEHHVGAARLAATDLARRDVVARSGPPARAVSGGYSSSVVVAGGVAVARYVVDRPETAAALAAAGGARLLVRADPGSGSTVLDGTSGGAAAASCPAGPDVLAPAPPRSVLTRRSPDGTGLEVSWTPASGDATPSAWEIRAVGDGRPGDQPVIAVRTPGVATTAALTGLVPGSRYTVEVRAVTGASLGPPLLAGDGPAGTSIRVDGAGPPGPPDPTTDRLGVRFAVRPGTQVYYTADGSSPRDGDAPAVAAQLYTGLVLVRPPGATLSWVAVDDVTGALGDVRSEVVDQPSSG